MLQLGSRTSFCTVGCWATETKVKHIVVLRSGTRETAGFHHNTGRRKMGASQAGDSLDLRLVEFVPICAFWYSIHFFFFLTNISDTYKTEFLASSESTL